jgi:sporulation protein YlmC with PRC-barrel domain
MKRLHLIGIVSAIAFTGAAHAGGDNAPSDGSPPGTVNPIPATSRAEGTAADATPPGETAVRGTAASQAPASVTSQGQQVVQEKRLAAADVKSGDRRSSAFAGKGVYSEKGALLGEVKDLVIDPMSGRVTHAVVATGGSVTGGSQSLAAVPWDVMRSGMHHGRVVMDEERLNGAPSFNTSQWPDLRNSNWSQQADRYWERDSAE